ncbi:hypothetical protein DUI87_05080 [Hirundo rustica rustica]|uniref:Reverse transcriptase/retrotransposon-derived protein RNase H-like domain-containing protein n=1 Tax=Hirundo rustica rustica TaxID=333673 RepID=A0A3M0KY20_HIRRU|nr:hypothetical protein DUI87_05080 [Hirundo rustica rustica]
MCCTLQPGTMACPGAFGRRCLGRPGVSHWGSGAEATKANYTPTEKEILAAYEGLQAALEVIGTEMRLLFAP